MLQYIAPLAICASYAAPLALAYGRRVVALVCAAPYVALVVSAGWFAARSWMSIP